MARDENDNYAVSQAKKKSVELLRLNSSKYSSPTPPQEQAVKAATGWSLHASHFAHSTCNPVRKLIEQMRIEPNPALPMIALSIGDPTVLSDIGKPDSVARAIASCVSEKRFDGYTPSYGTEACRQSIASYYSRPDKGISYTAGDVYLTNGCSQALDLCITVLAGRGQNILIPKPGFSIYKTLAGTLGIAPQGGILRFVVAVAGAALLIFVLRALGVLKK